MAFRSFMDEALAEARAAAERGEVPVGAVMVSPAGEIVARAGNRTREMNDVAEAGVAAHWSGRPVLLPGRSACRDMRFT